VRAHQTPGPEGQGGLSSHLDSNNDLGRSIRWLCNVTRGGLMDPPQTLTLFIVSFIHVDRPSTFMGSLYGTNL